MGKWDEYIVDTPQTETGSKWDKYVENSQPQENNPSLLAKVAGAGTGVSLGIPVAMGAGKLAQGAINVAKMVPTAFSANYGRGDMADAFANKVNKAFVQAHTNKINEFGADLNKWATKNPTASVDLSDLVTDVQADPNMSTTAVRILKKTPKLDALLADPKLASEVPLKDAQDIINHLNKKIKVGGYDIQEAINTVKGKQLEAFPEMSSTRAKYAEFMDSYKPVKNYFKVNKVLPGIENKFGGAQGNVRVDKILPKDIMKEINSYRMASKSINPIKAIAKSVMGGAGRGLAVAPQALQVFNLWRLRNDPEAQYNAMLGGGDLYPQGSLDREIQQGRVI